jgi:hypothetical protein
MSGFSSRDMRIMEPRKIKSNVVPESALLWFGLTYRQHAAVLAAITYFSAKLQNPEERNIAHQARQVLMSPHYWSLPSEQSARDEADSVEVAQVPKGFGGFKR